MVGRWVAAASAFGLLLRLPWFTDRPLWLDECHQAWVSEYLLGVLHRSAWADLHPPLFSLIAALLMPLGPVVALRLPSLVAGVLAPAVMAWAVEPVRTDPRMPVFAAWWVACHPAWVAWSREGRPWALGLVLLTFAIGCWLRCSGPAPLRTWLVALAASGLAVGTLHGAWFTVLPVAAAVCWAHRDAAETRIAAVGLLLLGGASGFDALDQWSHQGGLVSDHFGPLFTPEGWLHAFGWLSTGGRVPGPVSIAVVLGVLFLVRRAPPRPEWLGALALLAAANVLGMYPVGASRHLLILLPVLCWWGVSVTRDHERAVVLGAWAVLSVLRAPGVPVQDLPALARSLEPYDDGSEIWVDARVGRPFQRYVPWRGPEVVAPFGSPVPPRSGWIVAPSPVPPPVGWTVGPQFHHEGVWAGRWDPLSTESP